MRNINRIWQNGIPLPLMAVFAFLPSCTTAPADNQNGAVMRRDGTAAIGETTWVGGPTVTPLELLEDSRCPAGTQCVWPGQVRLRVRVTDGSGARQAELTSIHPLPIADGALALANISPARIAPGKIASKDYRFTFTFEGGAQQ